MPLTYPSGGVDGPSGQLVVSRKSTSSSELRYLAVSTRLARLSNTYNTALRCG